MMRRYVFVLALMATSIAGTGVVRAAVDCRDGKPFIAPVEYVEHDCHCFDKAPAGTKIYRLKVLQVSRTPGAAFGNTQTFGETFDWDAPASCDSKAVTIRAYGATHVYPSRFTTVAGSFEELSVYPGGPLPDNVKRGLAAGWAELAETR